MGTNIVWAEETTNPFPGCVKVSAGCRNCYAEKQAAAPRLQQFEKYRHVISDGKWNGKFFVDEKAMFQPMHWKNPRKIFVNSMGDMFRDAVPFTQLDRQFAVFALCQQHTFQILTKYDDRMLEYYTKHFKIFNIAGVAAQMVKDGDYFHDKILDDYKRAGDVLPNVWTGVTIENQKMANKRIVNLMQIPAALRWVSMEPMLEDIDFKKVPIEKWWYPPMTEEQIFNNEHFKYNKLGWVVIGAESGKNRRRCNVDDVRNVLTQCKAANVPVMVKQLDLDGRLSRDPSEWPEDLRVQEFPEVKR